MSKDYTRIAPSYEAVKALRKKLKAAAEEAEKNSDLHENPFKKPTLNNVSIQRGIRAAKDCWWGGSQGVIVYIDSIPYNPTTTPSHNIPLLIHSLPKMVESTTIDEETLSPIMLPFKLPEWWKLSRQKYTGDMLKPYFYQLAMSELEVLSNNEYRLTPFVFTTSKALEERFKHQQRDRVDFLRDRLQKGLKTALQRPAGNQLAIWFALEMARRGQPHIQGAMLIRPDEQETVKQVFYDLNGGDKMTSKEKQYHLRLRLDEREKLFAERGHLYTDLNWADYNLKERSHTRKNYNNLKPIIAVSQHLASYTEDYYNRLRKEFNRQLRVAATVIKTTKPKK